MNKIVIADPVDSSSIEYLKSFSFDVLDVADDKSRLTDSLKEANALLVRSATKVSKELLDGSPKLQIVGRVGVGLDNIDLEECSRRNIKVVNSPEGPTRSVAELALLFMLAGARKLIGLNQDTKDGLWPKKRKGSELFEKTLGIIGSGAIGGQLAKYALAMGMKVLAYDIVINPKLKELPNFTYVDLDSLITTSDFISLHVPLLEATKHMINEKSFEKMKDNVVIINCSRGGTIDEMALVNALKDDKVAYAALDVYETEPVPVNSELLQHPRIITTPHIGAQTFEAGKRNASIVCEKLIDFFKN